MDQLKKIRAKVLWQINAHGGLPEGVNEDLYSVGHLVGEVLTARDIEIKRLRQELAIGKRRDESRPP